MNKTEYLYEAIVERVIDGDTVVMTIDLGFRASMKIPVRLYGVDTDELNRKTGDGYAAKEFIEKHCPVGSKQLLLSHKNQADKYGRWLGTILQPGGVSINEQLLTLALARPYFGGAK
jgi:endonuclease YncB( thermonuclease family)